MAGWAAGFAVGSRIGRDMIDTYKEADRQREFRDIAAAKPEQLQGFTPQQGEQLRAAAASGQYDVAYDPERVGYTVTPKADPTQQGFIAQAPVTDFLGQRFEGAPTPDQMLRARQAAYANAVSRWDPIRGLQMQRDVAADERATEEFGWKRDDRPRQVRLGELQISGAERTEREGVRRDAVTAIDDEIAKKPRKDLELLASELNTPKSQVPMLYMGKTDKGYQFVTTDPVTWQPTGQRFEVNEAQLRQLASAAELFKRGYGAEGMAKLSAVNKDIADNIGRWNQTLGTVVGSQNQAKQFGVKDEQKDRELDINSRKADAYGRYVDGMVSAANARASGAGAGAGQPAPYDANTAMKDYYKLFENAQVKNPHNPKQTYSPQFLASSAVSIEQAAYEGGIPMTRNEIADAVMSGRAALDPNARLQNKSTGEWMTGPAYVVMGPNGTAPRIIPAGQWAPAPNQQAPAPAQPAKPAQPAGGFKAQSNTEPVGRDEWVVTQRATQLGYTPVGRGNAVFGKGELLFQDKNGNTVWASQIK